MTRSGSSRPHARHTGRENISPEPTRFPLRFPKKLDSFVDVVFSLIMHQHCDIFTTLDLSSTDDGKNNSAKNEEIRVPCHGCKRQ